MTSLPRWQVRLTRVRDGGAPERLEFRCDELNVGRSACDLTLPGPAVSRRHCELLIDERGQLLVCDPGSTNGTYLNERRLEPLARHVVRVGDFLRIGQWHLQLDRAPELVSAVMARSALLEAARDRAQGVRA